MLACSPPSATSPKTNALLSVNMTFTSTSTYLAALAGSTKDRIDATLDASMEEDALRQASKQE